LLLLDIREDQIVVEVVVERIVRIAHGESEVSSDPR
jgi:hypothetical protein